MLRFAVALLVVALIAGLFGFGLFAAVTWEAGKILFFVFLVLAVIVFLTGNVRARPPRI